MAGSSRRGRRTSSRPRWAGRRSRRSRRTPKTRLSWPRSSPASGTLAARRRASPSGSGPVRPTSPTWCARWTARKSRSRTCSSTSPHWTMSSSRRPAARSKAPTRKGLSRRGASSRPSRREGAQMSVLADQAFLLARRSVVRTVRQPANVVAPLLFPMMLLAVNSGGLKAETRLPGFPTNSFVAFALAVPFIQGALFATMNAGTDLARDIQTGFLNRLSLTPMRGVALLAGQLGGVVTLGVVQAVVYLSVGLAVGVRFESGVLGVLVLFAFAILVSLGFGALGALAALRTGSGEAVQSLFPAFFVFLFLSSMNIPRNLIATTWFRDVATANPVSYLLECVRSLIITGWDGEALALGFGIARDFESGFARRLLLAAPNRSGIVLGYAIAALGRWIVTAVVLTGIALAVGMHIGGSGVDVVGLYTLAVILNAAAVLWAAGVAMRLRTMQAGPIMQMPVFLVLFFAPVYVPLSLLQGWFHGLAVINPLTRVLESGRGFLAGTPTEGGAAFAIAIGLGIVFFVWALRGLRSAERAAG